MAHRILGTIAGFLLGLLVEAQLRLDDFDLVLMAVTFTYFGFMFGRIADAAARSAR